MAKKSKWLIFGGLLVAAVIALRFVVFRPKPVLVTVAAVGRGAVEDVVTNTRAGTIKAHLRTRLSPQTGGRVTKLPYKKGQLVPKDALLLQLDDAIQRAQLDDARRNVERSQAEVERLALAAKLAESDWKRSRKLAQDGIISAQDRDTLKSREEQAQAALKSARAARNQASAEKNLAIAQEALTQIRAPFGGILADCTTEVGEFITPAPPGVPIPPIMDLLDQSSIYVSAPIDEVDSEQIRSGQAVRVTVDSRPGDSFAGKVTRVAPYVNDLVGQNRTVEVEVGFDDPAKAGGLLPGTSANVEIILSRRADVVRVPTDAVAEGEKVLVLEAGRLSERAIQTGLHNWQFTEVTGGLKAGDFVVTARDIPEIKPGARAEAGAKP